MSNAQAKIRHCYRCGKEKLEQGTFRLLPGSSHITLCPECFQVVWGWHEQPSMPALGQKRQQKAEGSADV